MNQRALARELYQAALHSVEPGRVMQGALSALPTPKVPVHILAIGKAATAMANATIAALADRGQTPAGVLAVAPPVNGSPGIPFVAGDHPLPGPNSLAAASAIGGAVRMMREADECWVMLSGGASSLAAAPVDGVSAESLVRLFELLLASGLDIARMNAVRRRVLRWGGGRLAASIRSRPLRVFAISDVPGDAAADIGSGPCSPELLGPGDVRGILEGAGLLDEIPADVRKLLERPLDHHASGDERIFDAVSISIVARNADAVAAAAAKAREAGWEAAAGPALQGEAREAGRRLGTDLLHRSDAGWQGCLLSGGETTVSIGSRGAGMGGRCQEFALAAAAVLEGRERITLLAAGTDGRDGPTDAAGAIVDGGTLRRLRDAGIDSSRAVDAHDTYPALDAVGDLLRTGATGTNVMDLAIAVVA